MDSRERFEFVYRVVSARWLVNDLEFHARLERIADDYAVDDPDFVANLRATLGLPTIAAMRDDYQSLAATVVLTHFPKILATEADTGTAPDGHARALGLRRIAPHAVTL